MPALYNHPMLFNSTQSFANHLESIGELKRIKSEVDPVLEITEITDRVAQKYLK